MRTRERVFGILAIIGSIMSGVSQILLSILDTKRHPTAHRICLLLFIVGLTLTAVFTVAEVLLQPFQIRKKYTSNDSICNSTAGYQRISWATDSSGSHISPKQLSWASY